jgi:cyclopropane fatty-acyl-phospholipid synthase-like methyltransferase
MNINDNYFAIKDIARKGIVKYLEEVISTLPEYENPQILDIGCGAGVPSLWMAHRFQGRITAIDIDKPALEYLQQKIDSQSAKSSVTLRNISFFDFDALPESFDIILAEGFLNVVGFENGFKRIIRLLKPGGCFVIHDEYKNHEWKIEFIMKCKCRVINELFLDEGIWRREYYSLLEGEIKKVQNPHLRSLFVKDMEEIELCKSQPELFRSVYYVVLKDC